MSHIIFHKPPPIGAHVKIFHKSGQRAEPLLLLTFIGDDYTSGFTIPGHTFDASKITIIINDNILPTTEWTVSENRWQNNLKDPTMSKSVILLNKEEEYGLVDGTQGYVAPFTLSEADDGIPRDKIKYRLAKALHQTGREYLVTLWDSRRVVYTKVNSGYEFYMCH